MMRGTKSQHAATIQQSSSSIDHTKFCIVLSPRYTNQIPTILIHHILHPCDMFERALTCARYDERYSGDQGPKNQCQLFRISRMRIQNMSHMIKGFSTFFFGFSSWPCLIDGQVVYYYPVIGRELRSQGYSYSLHSTYSLLNGEPVGATNRVSQPSNSYLML